MLGFSLGRLDDRCVVSLCAWLQIISDITNMEQTGVTGEVFDSVMGDLKASVLQGAFDVMIWGEPTPM